MYIIWKLNINVYCYQSSYIQIHDNLLSVKVNKNPPPQHLKSKIQQTCLRITNGNYWNQYSCFYSSTFKILARHFENRCPNSPSICRRACRRCASVSAWMRSPSPSTSVKPIFPFKNALKPWWWIENITSFCD